MKNNIREILDKTNIYVLDEINILEYIDELEKVKEDYIKSLDKLDVLEKRINKAIEYITNGSDFKSIYFKKTDEELWKILLEDNIKNDLLEILRGETNE